MARNAKIVVSTTVGMTVLSRTLYRHLVRENTYLERLPP